MLSAVVSVGKKRAPYSLGKLIEWKLIQIYEELSVLKIKLPTR
jgi:hypothetical protein